VFKHECYKIFTRKSIYIVFFLVVLTMMYANSKPGDLTMKDEVYEELYQALGGPVTEEKVIYVREKMRASDMGEATSQTLEEGNVLFLVALSGMNKDALNERKETLEMELTVLSEKSYEYKVAAKELNMLNELGQPHGFYLIRAWQGMVNFIEPVVGMIFLSTLVILGLTPVFADEYTKRTAGLILATKHGKRKIVTVKMLAAMTYISVIYIALHLVNLFLQLKMYGGLQGWDAPIQGLNKINWYYGQSPYTWDIWQFYTITLSVQLFASVAVGILVLCLSVTTKNSMVTLFVSAAVLGIPFMIQQLGLDRGTFAYVANFNYGELMKITNLFDQFKAYNVFGFPMLYPHLLFFFISVITAFLVFFTYHRFRNQQVSG
jgi:hypothetical protein